MPRIKLTHRMRLGFKGRNMSGIGVHDVRYTHTHTQVHVCAHAHMHTCRGLDL